MMKGKISTTNNILPERMDKAKDLQTIKGKTVQHHQTSFVIIAKGTSLLGRKEKSKTRNQNIINGKAHQ